MEINCNNIQYTEFSTGKNEIFDLSCSFSDKKVYGIIGNSGSGKSTLLELIAQEKQPTFGEIEINHNQLFDARTIGYLKQNIENQFITMSVKEELKYLLLSFSYRVNEIDKRMVEVLKLVGLSEKYLDRNIHSLSHGEIKKLGLASVLIYNPKILLLDEPSFGLSPIDKKNLIKLLKKLKNKYHKLIIIVSQDMEFIHKVCDDIYVLNQGKIVLYGNKFDVFSKQKLLKKINVDVPNIISFENLVLQKKNIQIGYRDEINDLIKDVYRYVK